MKDLIMKPFILLITGISTSGKTTLLKRLSRNELLTQNIQMHDIDEIGVPEYGRKYWASYRVEELFGQSLVNYHKGVSSIISGVINPSEVLTSILFKPNFNIHFLLIDCEIKDFRKRLRQRLQTSGEQGPEVDIERLIFTNKEFARILRNHAEVLKNGHILNSSILNQSEMYEECLKIIASIGN